MTNSPSPRPLRSKPHDISNSPSSSSSSPSPSSSASLPHSYTRLLYINVLFITILIYILVNTQLIRHDHCPHPSFLAAPNRLSSSVLSPVTTHHGSLHAPPVPLTRTPPLYARAPADPDPPVQKVQHAEMLAAHARRRRSLPACARDGERAKGFLMVFMGHSGSTAITTELREHPEVRVGVAELVDHQAVFNTTAAIAEARSFFRAGVREQRTAGFKIRPWHILNDPTRWRTLVREFGLRIIWQHRKNIFKAAVGEYSHRVLHDKSVVEGLRRRMPRAERCAIGAGCSFPIRNMSSFANMLRAGVRSHRMITRAVQSLGAEKACVREVPYEDYLYARLETMRDLRRFLGLREVRTSPARFKATGDNMCEVVRNWDEVCDRFYGCVVWQWMMDDARNRCFCQLKSGVPDGSLCAMGE